MAEEKKMEEKKHYRTPILYLHKSKKGGHLYAFNVTPEDGKKSVLDEEIESLIMNVSDVEAVIGGQMKWAKVSVVLKVGGE